MTEKFNLRPAGLRHIPTLLHPEWTGDDSTTGPMRRDGGTVGTRLALSVFREVTAHLGDIDPSFEQKRGAKQLETNRNLPGESVH